MSTSNKQLNTEGPQPAEHDGSPTDLQPARKGAKLIADLSVFFTNRKHGRGGLFLPLVRVENDD